MDDVSFTGHAYKRLNERCSLTPRELASIIHQGKYIPLGVHQNDKHKQHRLFYSIKDEQCFVAVCDTNNQEIITVLSMDYHSAWRVDPDMVDEAKYLIIGRPSYKPVPVLAPENSTSPLVITMLVKRVEKTVRAYDNKEMTRVISNNHDVVAKFERYQLVDIGYQDVNSCITVIDLINQSKENEVINKYIDDLAQKHIVTLENLENCQIFSINFTLGGDTKPYPYWNNPRPKDKLDNLLAFMQTSKYKGVDMGVIITKVNLSLEEKIEMVVERTGKMHNYIKTLEGMLEDYKAIRIHDHQENERLMERIKELEGGEQKELV